MANNNWKQQQRAWRVARFQEEQERKERRERETKARNEQNAVLHAHGYTWHHEQDHYDDDAGRYPYVWQLRDGSGKAVTVADAMAAIHESEASSSN